MHQGVCKIEMKLVVAIFLYLVHAERSYDLMEFVFSWLERSLYSSATALTLEAFLTTRHKTSSSDLASLSHLKETVCQRGLHISAVCLYHHSP